MEKIICDKCKNKLIEYQEYDDSEKTCFWCEIEEHIKKYPTEDQMRQHNLKNPLDYVRWVKTQGYSCGYDEDDYQCEIFNNCTIIRRIELLLEK